MTRRVKLIYLLCSAYIRFNEILSVNQDPHFMKNLVHKNESSPNKIILMELKILKTKVIIIKIIINKISEF